MVHSLGPVPVSVLSSLLFCCSFHLVNTSTKGTIKLRQWYETAADNLVDLILFELDTCMTFRVPVGFKSIMFKEGGYALKMYFDNDLCQYNSTDIKELNSSYVLDDYKLLDSKYRYIRSAQIYSYETPIAIAKRGNSINGSEEDEVVYTAGECVKNYPPQDIHSLFIKSAAYITKMFQSDDCTDGHFKVNISGPPVVTEYEYRNTKHNATYRTVSLQGIDMNNIQSTYIEMFYSKDFSIDDTVPPSTLNESGFTSTTPTQSSTTAQPGHNWIAYAITIFVLVNLAICLGCYYWQKRASKKKKRKGSSEKGELEEEVEDLTPDTPETPKGWKNSPTEPTPPVTPVSEPRTPVTPVNEPSTPITPANEPRTPITPANEPITPKSDSAAHLPKEIPPPSLNSEKIAANAPNSPKQTGDKQPTVESNAEPPQKSASISKSKDESVSSSTSSKIEERDGNKKVKNLVGKEKSVLSDSEPANGDAASSSSSRSTRE